MVTGWGRWESGTMSRAAFPLSRSRGNFYRLGKYKWRLVRFEALGATFRLLIAFNDRLEQYKAMLGMDIGADTKYLASYEFHGTHPGWHAIVSCDPVAQLPDGIKTGPWQTRIPRARQWHRRQEFGVTEANAVRIACEFFGLPDPAADGPAGQ
jgi:hypothetical protein